jgi:hypothetical protein
VRFLQSSANLLTLGNGIGNHVMKLYLNVRTQGSGTRIQHSTQQTEFATFNVNLNQVNAGNSELIQDAKYISDLNRFPRPVRFMQAARIARYTYFARLVPIRKAKLEYFYLGVSLESGLEASEERVYWLKNVEMWII